MPARRGGSGATGGQGAARGGRAVLVAAGWVAPACGLRVVPTHEPGCGLMQPCRRGCGRCAAAVADADVAGGGG